MNEDGGNDGAMEAAENQKQVSLRFHSPLEIAKTAISTFPPPRRRTRGKVEIQKQDFHFPTGSNPLFHDQKAKTKKEALKAAATLPPSGPFFNQEMLFQSEARNTKSVYHVLGTLCIPCASLDRHSCRRLDCQFEQDFIFKRPAH